MPSFLHLLAKDLIQKYSDFENLTIIFPNKRAGLFLAEEISRYIEKPVWMPRITTLYDFIQTQTKLQKAEELPLIIKLYKAYLQVTGSEERFDDFYFWGSMLLNDFNDIDKHIVDAKSLFTNLVALKKLEYRFSFLTSEQIQSIRTFWSSFNPDKYSHEQEEFLKVWDKLYSLYTTFRASLYKDHLSYEGMALRYFYEHLNDYDYAGPLIFAGFNALNPCEKQIFHYFQHKGQAHFYWDYDVYYAANPFHEAGKFIREDLKLFHNELGKEHFNNFLNKERQIEYISVPSSIGQAKLIPTLTKGIEEKDHTQTAIVLCDEHMLLPVMHSIPENIRKINITMGYPVQNTSIAALVFLLGELRKYTKYENGKNYYYYKPVLALLNHKLVKDLYAEDINTLSNYIHQNNIIYISAADLHFNEITASIFPETIGKTAPYILHILQLFSQAFYEEKEGLYPVEKEFIFSLYTQLQSMHNTFTEEGIEPEDKLYMKIIAKVIHNLTVPFEGEPLEGLQIMGLLETRMLDFKNLIVLSANESILPKNNVPSSFIPYNLRVGFQLPTPEQQDALYAYYFYRLLQRSQNTRILYSATGKGINTGEMSRYLYQIKYESGLSVRETNFQNHISIQNNKPIEIPKNGEILRSLSESCGSEAECLSPSALNTYLDCPVKFYFKYVAGIKEKDQIAEELDHRLLGNIFHESSESLYTTVAQEEITPEILNRLIHNQPLIDRHIQESYLHFYNHQVSQLLNSGSNELILEIIRKYIRQMFRYDQQICPFRFISMEKKYTFPIRIHTGENQRMIFIGGVIDRIDETAQAIRIIDYKTGADTTAFKNIASIFDGSNPLRNKAAFQTLLYCLMYESRYTGNKPLVPGIYSTKLLFDSGYSHLLQCDKEAIHNFGQYREEFQQYLEKLLTEIFTPGCSFRQTTNEKKCRTCPYSGICRK